MRVEEIIPLLRKGKKVRLKNWPKDIYIYLKDDTIKSSHGADLKDYVDTLKFKDISDIILPFFSSVVYQDWEIYKGPILDDIEKKYLSNVIQPYKKYYNMKIRKEVFWCYGTYQRIVILLCHKTANHSIQCINLPFFKVNSMYKGMELDETYTLEDLGL